MLNLPAQTGRDWQASGVPSDPLGKRLHLFPLLSFYSAEFIFKGYDLSI